MSELYIERKEVSQILRKKVFFVEEGDLRSDWTKRHRQDDTDPAPERRTGEGGKAAHLLF